MTAVLGMGVLLAAWLAPHASFAAHMTVHMSVVAIAAPLIAHGWARVADPVAHAPRFFSPLLASLAELVVVWTWHAPALHHAARHVGWVHGLEQGSFLLTGLWLWLSVFGGADRDARRGEGILALLLTSMHMTLLGALLALPPRALYGHGDLADQHLGGAIMLLVGGVVYLVGGLGLARGLLRTA